MTDNSWRTASVVKPFDADGDNVYGTDGYVLYMWKNNGWSGDYSPADTLEALPSYIAQAGYPPKGWGGGDVGNYGQIDDPEFEGFLHNSTHAVMAFGSQARGGTVPIVLKTNPHEGFRLGITVGAGNTGFEEDIDVGLVSSWDAGIGPKDAGFADYAIEVEANIPSDNVLTFHHDKVSGAGGDGDPTAALQSYYVVDIPAGDDDIVIWFYNNSNDNPGGGGLFFDSPGSVVVPGDFNSDGQLDAADLNLQATQMVANPVPPPAGYDLNNDGKVDYGDRLVWLHDLRKTWVGDTNLDNEFTSQDFVDAFASGKYETDGQALWTDGDWNGDQKFGSDDFVAAFADGGYEAGQRPAAVSAVPEPGAACLLLLGLLLFPRRRWN